MKKITERWIDIGKCIAIIGVVTDHMMNVLYYSPTINRLTDYSVTLFILLMGVTSFWSFDNSSQCLYKKVKNRIIGIVLPYIVACFVYCIAIDGGFYWNSFWTRLINFNASGPHYYVLLYLQLIVIAPLLFFFLKLTDKFKGGVLRVIAEFIVGGGVIACIAWACNIHSNIADIYASRLFGGSYILVLYIGLLVGKYYQKIINISKSLKVITGVVTLFFLAAIQFLIIVYDDIFKRDVILGSSLNPPGVVIIVYGFLFMMFVYFFDRLIAYVNRKLLNCLSTVLRFIGKHTLYIFLYHLLFVSILGYFINEWNNWFKIPVYYLVVIMGSVAIELIMKTLKKYIIDSYMFRRESLNGNDNA